MFINRPADLPPPVDAEDLEEGEEVEEQDIYPAPPVGWRWDDGFYHPKDDRLQIYLQRELDG